MWIWISITIILISLIGFLSWVVYRLTEQIEQIEDTLNWYQDWYGNFINLLADTDVKMKQVDVKGSFSSDDEIGFAFKTVKECIEQLTQMGAITYGGQTDSTEEIQGQEEEE
mgnify:CR=1 FL=1|tara:strand:+ start:479 stop:814 length:336 start_codon:yes stop_codon:yes gene_type:complete